MIKIFNIMFTTPEPNGVFMPTWQQGHNNPMKCPDL